MGSFRRNAATGSPTEAAEVLGRAKASTKPVSESASLRGDARPFPHDTATQAAVAEIYTGKFRYKRTATADPNVAVC